jgi:hypothetical protein
MAQWHSSDKWSCHVHYGHVGDEVLWRDILSVWKKIMYETNGSDDRICQCEKQLSQSCVGEAIIYIVKLNVCKLGGVKPTEISLRFKLPEAKA